MKKQSVREFTNCALMPGRAIGFIAFSLAQIILLLCGDDKSTQLRDIERAHEFWRDYQRRNPA